VESERHEVRSIVGLPMRQATVVANAQTSNSEELFSRHDTRRKARVGGGWAEYTSAAGRRCYGYNPRSFMSTLRIKELSHYIGQRVIIDGWLYNKRTSRNHHCHMLRDERVE